MSNRALITTNSTAEHQVLDQNIYRNICHCFGLMCGTLESQHFAVSRCPYFIISNLQQHNKILLVDRSHEQQCYLLSLHTLGSALGIPLCDYCHLAAWSGIRTTVSCRRSLSVTKYCLTNQRNIRITSKMYYGEVS